MGTDWKRFITINSINLTKRFAPMESAYTFNFRFVFLFLKKYLSSLNWHFLKILRWHLLRSQLPCAVVRCSPIDEFLCSVKCRKKVSDQHNIIKNWIWFLGFWEESCGIFILYNSKSSDLLSYLQLDLT